MIPEDAFLKTKCKQGLCSEYLLPPLDSTRVFPFVPAYSGKRHWTHPLFSLNVIPPTLLPASQSHFSSTSLTSNGSLHSVCVCVCVCVCVSARAYVSTCSKSFPRAVTVLQLTLALDVQRTT